MLPKSADYQGADRNLAIMMPRPKTMISIIVRNRKEQIVGIALSPRQSTHEESLPFLKLAKHGLAEAHLRMIISEVLAEKTSRKPIFM